MLWLFYILIVLLGILTSYTDFKENKVKNKHLIIFASFGLILHLFFLSFQIIDLKYLGLVILYTTIAFIFGFLLWILKFWAAGDAKLYTLFVFLIPLSVYQYVSTEFLPLSVVINTFLPVFVYYFVKSLIISSWEQKFAILKKAGHPMNILGYLLYVFALGWVVRWVLYYLNITSNFFYSIIGIIILSRLILYIFKEHTLIVMAIISFFRIIFNYDFIVTKEFLVPYLITTIIYAFIIMFVYELSNVFVKKVRHQGRILTFYETTPFAIFLFIGTLLTIVCSGNILLFFRSLF